MKRLFEEAFRLVAIDSVSAKGNEALVNYVENLMRDRGLKVTLQQVMHSNERVSKKQYNVIGFLGDFLTDRKIRKGLLLSSHLDTITPGRPNHWTETNGNPFEARVASGKIYGLGVADAKIDFLCKLFAVQRFREKKLKMPIYLVGTCGEELGMFGSKYLLQSHVVNPLYTLIGGPTQMKVAHAFKSHQVFRLSIGYHVVEKDARGFNRRINLYTYGRSAHSAFPNAGENAIVRQLGFLRRIVDNGFEFQLTKMEGGNGCNQIPDWCLTEFFLTSHQFEDFKRYFREMHSHDDATQTSRVELGALGDVGISFLPEVYFDCVKEIEEFLAKFQSELERERDDAFRPPFGTVTLGKLRQEFGQSELLIDLRLLPGADLTEVESRMRNGIYRISARYPSLNLTLERETKISELNLKTDHSFLNLVKDVMKDADIEPEFLKSSLSTEAGDYVCKDYHVACIGPGSAEFNVHGPNESVSFDQVQKAVRFYEKMIEKVCV